MMVALPRLLRALVMLLLRLERSRLLLGKATLFCTKKDPSRNWSMTAGGQ